jgi:hypothetical protein
MLSPGMSRPDAKRLDRSIGEGSQQMPQFLINVRGAGNSFGHFSPQQFPEATAPSIQPHSDRAFPQAKAFRNLGQPFGRVITGETVLQRLEKLPITRALGFVL